MAITLDELLGRNVNTQDRSPESFPTYDEFNSARRNVERNTSVIDTPYNYFAQRTYSAPCSAESVRRYEAERKYEAPRDVEYRTRDYPFFEAEARATQAPTREVFAEAKQFDAAKEEFTPQKGYSEYRPMNLFEFTARDNDRLSDNELYSKLSFAPKTAARPLFDSDEGIQALQNTRSRMQVNNTSSLFARKSEKAYKNNGKSRGKLNLKGKIILGVYVAIVLVVAILVGVNAKSINAGTAVAPAASVSQTESAY